MSQSDDLISRRAAIDAMVNTLWHYPNECYRNLNEYEFAKDLVEFGLKSVPSAQPEYEPVTAEDFAKVMSESTIYGFMAWYGEAIALMKRMGFVICKKTM